MEFCHSIALPTLALPIKVLDAVTSVHKHAICGRTKNMFLLSRILIHILVIGDCASVIHSRCVVDVLQWHVLWNWL